MQKVESLSKYLKSIFKIDNLKIEELIGEEKFAVWNHITTLKYPVKPFTKIRLVADEKVNINNIIDVVGSIMDDKTVFVYSTYEDSLDYRVELNKEVFNQHLGSYFKSKNYVYHSLFIGDNNKFIALIESDDEQCVDVFSGEFIDETVIFNY